MSEYTRRRLIEAGLGTAAIGTLAGCASTANDSENANTPSETSATAGPTAQSSFFVFGDFAREVAGEAATAETLVPIGQHGHGWEPGPQIQGTILESELFVYGIEGFQPWADDLVTNLRDDDTEVDIIAAGSSVDLIEGGHDHGGEDEHEGSHEDGHHGEGDHEESEHGETPWEWAGLYHLAAGSYSYTFQEGPDPEMQLAVLTTDEGGDHGIHHVEETATQLYGSDHDAHTPVEDGGTLTPSDETLYHLEFADSGETTFSLEIETEGHYVLFGQHMPAEFDAVITDNSGSTVEPEVTEAAGNHNHNEETEGDHESEGEHDHESEGEDNHEGEAEHEEEGSHDHDHGSGSDPHFWLDPQRAKQAVTTIEDGFAAVDETNAEAYAENAENFRARLDDLDSTLESTISEAPKNTLFVAGHNAFQYLETRYGLQIETLTGLSPDDQPTPEDIERAQEIIAEHDLTYVCADPLESQTAAEQLVAETDATEVLPLTPIPGQTQDWADNGWGYVEVMENVNLETLETALDSA